MPSGNAERSFDDDYTQEDFLSRGSFCGVWRCRERETGEQRACKVFVKATAQSRQELYSVKREVDLLRLFATPAETNASIVRLHDAYEDDKSIRMVLELCGSGDLLDLINSRGPLPEEAAKLVLRLLASAVAHCHSLGIAHCDIKPDNVLLAGPVDVLYDRQLLASRGEEVAVKLADFGAAATLQEGQTRVGLAGSWLYAAPEVLQGRAYGVAADVWSLGVLLFVMLTGQIPFQAREGQGEEGVRRAILQGKVSSQLLAARGVSGRARSLVLCMLQVDPLHRYSASVVLAHPWFKDGPENKEGDGEDPGPASWCSIFFLVQGAFNFFLSCRETVHPVVPE